jgi:hypothetical protein
MQRERRNGVVVVLGVHRPQPTREQPELRQPEDASGFFDGKDPS